MDIVKYNAYLNYLLNKYNIKGLDVEFLLKVVSTMIEFIDDNILQLMYTDLYENVYDYSLELMKSEYIDSNILENIYDLSKKETIKMLESYLKMGLSFVFKYVIPKRAYKKSYIRSNKIN